MLETKFRLANVEIEGQGIEAHYAELSLMESNLLVTCLASACAGLIGRTICHPIDTVKAQVQMSNKDIRLKDLIHTIWKSEGIAGFYRGIGAVTIGGVPGVCVYITTYEKCKHFLQQRSALFREQPFLSYLFSGMAAEATW